MQCRVPLIDNKFAVIKDNEDGIFDYCSDNHARRIITKREDSFICTKVVKWPTINVLSISPKDKSLVNYSALSKYQSYIREVHTPTPCTFVCAKKKTHFICESKLDGDHNLLIDSTDEGLAKYENGSWDFRYKPQTEDKILRVELKDKIVGIYSNPHGLVPRCENCQGQTILHGPFNPHLCNTCQHICQCVEKIYHGGKIYVCENQIKYKNLLYAHKMVNIDNQLFVTCVSTIHCRQFPNVKLYKAIYI